MNKRTDINEVINLLHEYNPQVIESLKIKFPKIKSKTLNF